MHEKFTRAPNELRIKVRQHRPTGLSASLGTPKVLRSWQSNRYVWKEAGVVSCSSFPKQLGPWRAPFDVRAVSSFWDKHATWMTILFDLWLLFSFDCHVWWVKYRNYRLDDNLYSYNLYLTTMITARGLSPYLCEYVVNHAFRRSCSTKQAWKRNYRTIWYSDLSTNSEQ